MAGGVRYMWSRAMGEVAFLAHRMDAMQTNNP